MNRRAKTTIVDRFGGRPQTRCGYCKQCSQRYSHGMWAHCMTAADYQDLIDRGWRRSGQYCYKPNNAITCCPCYTIKCDAKTFQLSKSHKKNLKKVNSYLRTGQKGGGGGADNRSIKSDGDNDVQTDHNTDCDMKVDGEEQKPTEATESSALAESKMITSNQPKVSIDIDNVLDIIEKAENGPKVEATTSSSSANTDGGSVQKSDTGTCSNRKSSNESNKRGLVAGPDPTKPLQPKAKLLRQQRKAEKQQAKANTMATDTNVVTPSVSEKMPKNIQKDLKSLIDEIPADGAHKLKVKLVPSHAGSTEAALNLYRRYQIGIHKDPPEKITRKSFENFLVRSPLQHETPDDGPTCGYGSFHQQYWLDDKLIAVGVIDILPKCVSSVYFFYDPEYSFLTLGTYGTLREVQFVRELNESTAELSEYYMGFYIHSCPKMRYKGKLHPSYLLCPETYTWHLINDDILKLLDESKYSRFNLDPQASDLNEFNPATDLNHLRLLVDYKYCLTYRDYKEYKGTEGTDSDEDDFDNFSEYGKLVGKVLSRRLYLVT
ncbi:arginyl-tRNA--protein transferase 1-like isoform X2 [Sitodiplosis mosellana]|uniref:arginyl-tRNA--protein transferase 1-like isoform X2 n=1 Tax=Sitodiplosis mosellana TaxID=263140 RepID=UPI0024443A93|nr:arginyl-tRNA--protein transferase 1-like isoform X2 [Sitodiplosis mosellana]